MALRSDVVEAAGARSSERRRAWGDSSKRASEPDAEPPPRARWSTRYSPRTYVPLTRRLRRAVAVCPEEPGLTRLRPPSHPSSATSPSSTRSPRRLARRRLARRHHARRRHAAVPTPSDPGTSPVPPPPVPPPASAAGAAPAPTPALATLAALAAAARPPSPC
jgi:hypothetical protein